jgi:hypothetical protein
VDFAQWNGDRLITEQLRQKGTQWAEKNTAFQKIRQETGKAKARAKQTHVAVFLDGMWQERLELAATRKEAKDAGLLTGNGEDDGEPVEEKKLDELVATDPYIQVALFLFKDGRNAGLSAGASR